MKKELEQFVWWPEHMERPIGKVEILERKEGVIIMKLIDNPFNCPAFEVGKVYDMYDPETLVSLHTAANRMDYIALGWRNYGKSLLKSI